MAIKQLLSDRAEQPECEPICLQRLLSWLPSGVRLLHELRKACREAGVTVRVVRNTLLRRAVEGTSYEVGVKFYTNLTPR